MSLVISLGLAMQRLTAADATLPPIAAPVNAALPAIAGTAQEGQTLTASPGTWTNGPTGFAWQWQRGGAPISGATAGSYVLQPADVGTTVTVRVIAINAGGVSAPATSVATVTVTEALAPSLFDFQLFNEAGSTTITNVPNLRISMDGGTTFNALGSVPGHTLSIARGADGKSLVISGWTGGVVPEGLRVHYEQALPGEPNSASANTTANLPALFARRTGGPAPVNTNLPGMTVSATRASAPVGVI